MIEYEMTDDEFAEIVAACRPTPVLYGDGGRPLFASQQENANYAWQRLGQKRGFDYMTVQPGRSQKHFMAEPVDPSKEPV